NFYKRLVSHLVETIKKQEINNCSGLYFCIGSSGLDDYVARGPRLAIFRGFMLHVDLLLQHSEALYCTWTFSCNIRELYIARGPSLATFVILFTQTKKLRQIKIVSACFITLALAD